LLGGVISIGMGIFLSSVILALVVLYAITKDRWRWRSIAGRIGLLALGILVLAGVSASAFYVWSNLPPSVQTEYAGLRIGMKKDEVKYVKGYPPSVLEPPNTEGEFKGDQLVVATKDLLKNGKKIEDYNSWTYEDAAGSRLDLSFNPSSSALIVISCYSESTLRLCPPISGITNSDSEQSVISKFGKPDEARLEGPAKSLFYKKIGLGNCFKSMASTRRREPLRSRSI
jgi:hypothetical protein